MYMLEGVSLLLAVALAVYLLVALLRADQPMMFAIMAPPVQR